MIVYKICGKSIVARENRYGIVRISQSNLTELSTLLLTKDL